jgi:hypothetical protein
MRLPQRTFFKPVGSLPAYYVAISTSNCYCIKANAASKSERNALAQDVELLLSHPGTVEHDFNASPLLTIPVSVKMLNMTTRSVRGASPHSSPS